MGMGGTCLPPPNGLPLSRRAFRRSAAAAG
jgi:hypothetical protein